MCQRRSDSSKREHSNSTDMEIVWLRAWAEYEVTKCVCYALIYLEVIHRPRAWLSEDELSQKK